MRVGKISPMVPLIAAEEAKMGVTGRVTLHLFDTVEGVM